MEQLFLRTASHLRQRAYNEALTFLADAEEAEDVAQEVMIKMWEKRASLMADTDQLEAYATTLARNLCRNRHRSKKRHPLLRLFWGDDAEEDVQPVCMRDVTDNTSLPDARMEQQEQELCYTMALQRLPDHWRQVMIMRGEEQRSYADIALILGTTEGAVRNTLCKARKRMSVILAELMR